jgi:hypothetical protein
MSKKKTVKAKRIKYNTPVDYPQTFTLRELYKQNHHKFKLITLYSRIQKGIDNGEISEVSLRENEDKRRGRKEIVYSLSTPEPVLATAEVATPSNVNW